MKSPFVLDVTADTFEKDVVEASKRVPVIVDFWASWCGPCRALGPVLEKLAAEYAGRFRLAKVNSDENLEISRRFNVRSIPDVRAFRDGRQVDQFIGALPEEQVRAFISPRRNPTSCRSTVASSRASSTDLENAARPKLQHERFLRCMARRVMLTDRKTNPGAIPVRRAAAL